MAEKVTLKIMKCPTCGASLKAENSTDVITCVYCGNSIVPVTEATHAPQQESAPGAGGTVKVEGIKTSSSALAYIELFFEEYDWEAFSYAQALSISAIDMLVSSLKVSSADDKNTWFACFKAISVPFNKKIEGCKKILTSVIEEYKKDNLDAYSKFDAYKRISAMIATRKEGVVTALKKIVAKAAKYGATDKEVSGLLTEIEQINDVTGIDAYSKIESIPEIESFIFEKNERIVAQLAANGIHAQSEYAKAKALIEEKNYVEALNILRSLKGYSDTKALIEKLDKYFLISDILEIEGILYYFKEENDGADAENITLSLYPTVEGKIADKPIIKNIGQIITNYADILYYLDGERKLKQYNFSTGTEAELFAHPIAENSFYSHDRSVFLQAAVSNEDSSAMNDIIELDLTNGVVHTIFEKVYSIRSITGNMLVFHAYTQTTYEENEYSYNVTTNIMNVETLENVVIGPTQVSVVGFVNNQVVFTLPAPNALNKNLYVRALNQEAAAKLVEKNIFKFCDIIDGKLFYYIGNTTNQSLIHINCDGTGRKEWPLYIREVLFEQGGWLYFIRKAGYNSILCKSRLDGSKYSIIAADIDKFIDIKNGYLYYINDESTLVKVRMDGSNLQKLCNDVEKVLSVRENKVIFISLDDRIQSDDPAQAGGKAVKSIYAVDFSGSGKIKLAYDIKCAEEYDDNTVYFISTKKVTDSSTQETNQQDSLNKLNVETNRVAKLLDVVSITTEEEGMSGFTIAMLVMAVAFFFAFIGFAAESSGLGILGLMGGISALLIGIGIKLSKNE